MPMMMTTTTSSGKRGVGKEETGVSGKWKSCAIAVFLVVAGIRVPAQVEPGTPHGLLGVSGDAQPSGEGPQP